MSVLSIDFETRSTVDLQKTGVYPYAEDHTTDVWLMAWAFDDEEPDVWFAPHTCRTLGLDEHPLPERIVEHLAAGGQVRAWNVGFERAIWREIMVKRYAAPEIRLEQWVDTQAEAAALALPLSLDECASVCGAKEQKDPKGYSLMLRMSRPRRVNEDGSLVWWDDPERIRQLAEYAKQDVRTERAIAAKVRRLSPKEREIWLLDQRINDRGILLDRALVLAAQDIVTEGMRRASDALSQISEGKISAITDLNGFKRWLAEQGISAPSLAKKTVKEMLESRLPDRVYEALVLRYEAGKSSIAKLRSMLAVQARDGRLHGLLRYHGASTGRWSGALVQPQNFPRGEIENPEQFIPAVLARDYNAIDLFAPPLSVVSSLLRAMLVAAPGCEFMGADYVGIEARVLAWLAGQDDLVAAFEAGEDVYVLAAAATYGIPPEKVTKQQRQLGKLQILGLGFGMGAAKAVTAAKDVFGLSLDETQAKEIVAAYREKNSKIVEFWRDANASVIRAVENPGLVVEFGAQRLKAVRVGQWLFLGLPSGRMLAYAAPRVVEAEMPWSTPEAPVTRPSVEFSGISSQPGAPRRWSRIRLYGGLIAENVTQAVARDVLAEGMLAVETVGWPVVLTVHDEIVCEVPEGADLEAFRRRLEQVPAWAAGLPIKVEAWRGRRYRK